MLQRGEGLLGGVQLGVNDLRVGAEVAVAGRDPSCHAVADVTVEVGAGGPKVLGWRVGRYWVLDDGLRDTRGDRGQIAREDVLFARDRVG
jgi:hypothetical protein